MASDKCLSIFISTLACSPCSLRCVVFYLGDALNSVPGIRITSCYLSLKNTFGVTISDITHQIEYNSNDIWRGIQVSKRGISLVK